MKTSTQRRWYLLIAVLLTGAVVAGRLPAQSSKSKSRKKAGPSASQLRSLKLRESKSNEQFIRDQVKLAKDYEQAGLLEESKKLLQTIRKIKDDLPGLKEKIDLLEETILSDNPFEFELAPLPEWGQPIARVRKGKPFRIQSKGMYKLLLEAEVGPKGFSTQDPIKKRDMARGVPCGALMALLIPVNDKGKPGKPDPPITVGESREITPKENGLLFLAVNAPPGHKSTGTLDIQISGYLTPPGGGN